MERIQLEHMGNPANQDARGIQAFQEQVMSAEAKKFTLVSAIDGSPFTATFDSESRRMLMHDMNGEPMGTRNVQDEEEFLKLVEINANFTRQNNETTERINRNVSVIDVETKSIIEYDCNGHGIVTPLENLNPETRANHQGSRACSQTVSQHNMALSNAEPASITPMSFDTGSVYMQVPYATGPSNGPLVGGSFLYTTSSTTTVELWTYYFPSGMNTIDVRFINAIGDDSSTFLDVLPMKEVRHTVKYKGEPYGARVTSYSGTFNNVQLRYFANGSGTGGGGLTAPTVVTYYPSSISSGGATLEGNITLNGGAIVTEYGFYIWTGSSPATWLPIYQNTNGGFFNWVRTGLSPNTLYSVQAYAKNSVGTAYGSVQSFWTSGSVTTPTVITNNPSINGANVTFNGNITMNGGATITEYGFDFWPSGGSTIRRTFYQSTNGGTYAWNENLSSNTMYYVRAFARNSAGYAYGTTISFWTQNVLSAPTVLTNAVTNISSSQATFNGNITANGGSMVTEYGFDYWPTSSPSSTTRIKVGYNTTGGIYSWARTLASGTQYTVRAYAINSTGIGCGTELPFTTQGSSGGGVVVYNPNGLLSNTHGIRAIPFKTNAVGQRGVAAYNEVIDDLAVESRARYQRIPGGDTYCNIFVWDATVAMNAEIPHITCANREIPQAAFVTGNLWQTANNMHDWLRDHGTKYGWTSVTADQAIARAGQGFPTVVVWKNTSGIGHIAMVVPNKQGDTGVMIAQAGGSNYRYATIATGFSNKSPLLYYSHN